MTRSRLSLVCFFYGLVWSNKKQFLPQGPPKFGLGAKSALQKLQIYVALLKAIFETGVFIEQKLVGWKQKNTLETTFIISFGASFLVLARKFAYHSEIPF